MLATCQTVSSTLWVLRICVSLGMASDVEPPPQDWSALLRFIVITFLRALAGGGLLLRKQTPACVTSQL